MTLLIVDDSPKIRQLLYRTLQCEGYDQLLLANSAEEAFEHLGVSGPVINPRDVSLILLDRVMPGMDGIEACRIIKDEPELRDIPVLMITAYDTDASLREAFTAGAIDYIRHPIRSVELLARVQSALSLVGEMDLRKRAYREMETLCRSLEEKTIALQDALDKVKLLRGLLPICASCRKIREGAELWSDLEDYVTKHSEAEFTHCICPDCSVALYPKYFQ